MTDHNSINLLILLMAGCVLVYAAVSDVRYYRIPNSCSLLLIALFPAHAWLSPGTIDYPATALAAISVFVISLGFYAMKRLGGGDVKLMAAVAVWAGAAHLADFIVIMALAGGVLSLIYITHFYIVPALRFDHAGPNGSLDTALATKLPYGVAIASGGLAVLYQLAL